MSRWTWCIILFFISLQVSGQSRGLPFSKYYSTHDYQGGIQNFAFTQSSSGLIYVANNFGLLEYDGSEWRRYSLPNSTKIRDVAINEAGVVFVSGQAEFGYFKPNLSGRLTYYSLLEKLPQAKQNLEEIWKILFVGDKVIFCTFDEIFVFDKDLNLSFILESETRFESFHFASNNLFVNQIGSGLHFLENEQLIPVAQGRIFGDQLVSGLISLTTSRQLVFTRNEGIFEISPTQRGKWKANLPENLQINAVKQLKNGNIAIGSQRHGILILDQEGNLVLSMDKENGLRNNSVLSLFEDVSGNLWIGHNNGITLLELSLPFRLIDQFSKLPGTGYDAFLSENRVIFGTNYGLYQETSDENGISPIAGGTGHVYQITQINNLILSAQNDGAFVLQNGKSNPIQGPQGIWNFQQLRDYPNLIIAGSYSGLLLFEYQNGTVRFLRKLQGYDESARLLEQDSNGDIWVGHGYKGIYRLRIQEGLERVESKFYGMDSGLPTTLLNSVWKLNNQIVFSTESGLYRYNSSTDRLEIDPLFEPYFGRDFLATSMVEDPLGNIFYIGDNEAGVLKRQINGTYLKNYQIFNKIKPFLNDDLQNISLIRPNEVLFAANEGFIWYRLERETTAPISFPTQIRSVFITGSADSLIWEGRYPGMAIQSEIPEFPYSRANLRFEASNAIPNSETTTQYQFWLEGMEKDFGEWTTKRDKAYTNLREGSYTFHVRSKDIYGQVSDEDTYTFKVLPPWYRSIWAYLIYTVIGILILYFLFRWIDQKMKKTAARIKASQSKVIQQKESDLQNSQREIERLRTENLKAEIQIKNKELASATMHLINKNGFIEQTKSHLNTIIKKSNNEDVKNEIHKIITSIEKNIAGDKDWEQFEMHFDEVHGDFMTRFKVRFPDLSPQEIKLSAYLRMNLSSKEIANLMNITVRGVEIARYRLRKKIQLERSENLQEFILKF